MIRPPQQKPVRPSRSASAPWLPAQAAAALGLRPGTLAVRLHRARTVAAAHDDILGVEQIDKGLALGVKDPERAWFNRGLANEGLGDLNAAYRDYSRAAALKPDWPAPKTELARFTVKRP